MKESKLDQVQEDADVDMTPMIDVVFLLIIFFLCIDFKILEAKLPAYLPKDVGSQDDQVEPQEKLRIKIVCTNWGNQKPRPGSKSAYYLTDHRVEYMVGPEKVKTLDELKDKLQKIHDDTTKKVKDPKTGELTYMGVVVEPGTQVVYGDVAPVVDTIAFVGFKDINFGGGLGSKKTGAYAQQPRKN